jgi:hypothetical protein
MHAGSFAATENVIMKRSRCGGMSYCTLICSSMNIYLCIVSHWNRSCCNTNPDQRLRIAVAHVSGFLGVTSSSVFLRINVARSFWTATSPLYSLSYRNPYRRDWSESVSLHIAPVRPLYTPSKDVEKTRASATEWWRIPSETWVFSCKRPRLDLCKGFTLLSAVDALVFDYSRRYKPRCATLWAGLYQHPAF